MSTLALALAFAAAAAIYLSCAALFRQRLKKLLPDRVVEEWSMFIPAILYLRERRRIGEATLDFLAAVEFVGPVLVAVLAYAVTRSGPS